MIERDGVNFSHLRTTLADQDEKNMKEKENISDPATNGFLVLFVRRYGFLPLHGFVGFFGSLPSHGFVEFFGFLPLHDFVGFLPLHDFVGFSGFLPLFGNIHLLAFVHCWQFSSTFCLVSHL